MTSGGETFGGSLGWGQRPGLLIIDMMNAYFTAGSPFNLGSDAAVTGCARLLAAARAAGVPVLHTRVRYRPGATDGGLFVRKVSALRGKKSYTAALEQIATLRPQVDAFFEAVMVMSPDEAVRANRLALLEKVLGDFSGIADFSEIVVSG